jgi:hypothetical protein
LNRRGRFQITKSPARYETEKAVNSTDTNQQDEWMDYKDAAKLMHRPPGYFRRRNAIGQYIFWPHIERWQPGGRGTRLYVRREHVEAWIEASRTPPPSVTRSSPGISGYESIREELAGLGAWGTMKSLGLVD